MSTITPADASEIIAVITACHHRSAPRMDDPAAARATVNVWSELLGGYGFTCTDYVAAVKERARMSTDAPEPADLIRVARNMRNDLLNRGTDYHREDEPTELAQYPGDEKAAPDPPDYPREWTVQQRLSAYWYARKLHAMPSTTKGWHAILDQLEQHEARHEAIREGVTP